MTPPVESSARVLDEVPEGIRASGNAGPKPSNVIVLEQGDFNRGHTRESEARHVDVEGFYLRTAPEGILHDRKEWKAYKERVRAGEVLFHPNYNDDPDPAVIETVEKLVDTSRVIEVEHPDLKALPKRRVSRFVKRAFDIVACSGALVLCAIPMGIIAIAVKLDSPGPVFYSQERLGWSIIGQKSGAASGFALRPAPSALEATLVRHPRLQLGVAA